MCFNVTLISGDWYSYLFVAFLSLWVVSGSEVQIRKIEFGVRPVRLGQADHLVRDLTRKILPKVIRKYSPCNVQVSRPLIHRVLAALQREEGAEMQLDLAQMPIYDEIHLHISIATRHPVGVESIAHSQDILRLHRRTCSTAQCNTME